MAGDGVTFALRDAATQTNWTRTHACSKGAKNDEGTVITGSNSDTHWGTAITGYANTSPHWIRIIGFKVSPDNEETEVQFHDTNKREIITQKFAGPEVFKLFLVNWGKLSGQGSVACGTGWGVV